MNQTQVDSFNLYFGHDFPEYERTLLLTTINKIAGINLQEPPDERFLGIDDYMVIVTAVGATAAAATQVIKLIKEFNSIIKEKGIESKAELQRSEQKSLALNDATEKEIQEWLVQHPTKHQ
jgi:hypothetical protein